MIGSRESIPVSVRADPVPSPVSPVFTGKEQVPGAAGRSSRPQQPRRSVVAITTANTPKAQVADITPRCPGGKRPSHNAGGDVFQERAMNI